MAADFYVPRGLLIDGEWIIDSCAEIRCSNTAVTINGRHDQPS